MEMTPAAYQQAAAAHYNVWMDARSPWATQLSCPFTAEKTKQNKNRSSVGENIVHTRSFISLIVCSLDCYFLGLQFKWTPFGFILTTVVVLVVVVFNLSALMANI